MIGTIETERRSVQPKPVPPVESRPVSASPVLWTFLTEWEVALCDETKKRLRPYFTKVINTAGSPETEERRSWMLRDWVIREFVPAWLDAAGLITHAGMIRNSPEVVSEAGIPIADLERARIAARGAWNMAWSKANGRIGNAVYDSSLSVSKSVADAFAKAGIKAAVRASLFNVYWSLSKDAAGAVVWSAAMDWRANSPWPSAKDAEAAGRDALIPAIILLQESAFHLLDRMMMVNGTEGR